jgi:hypothetical protein
MNKQARFRRISNQRCFAVKPIPVTYRRLAVFRRRTCGDAYQLSAIVAPSSGRSQLSCTKTSEVWKNDSIISVQQTLVLSSITNLSNRFNDWAHDPIGFSAPPNSHLTAERPPRSHLCLMYIGLTLASSFL